MKTLIETRKGYVSIGRWSRPWQPHDPKDYWGWLEKVENHPEIIFPLDVLGNDGTIIEELAANYIAARLTEASIPSKVIRIDLNIYEVTTDLWGCDCEACLETVR